ncbi:CG30340 [Drosophila busckii]|uniref:CG30340 n=1 Tax=Drosophila busckii TaxID=30019 RepID=A0A0M3QUK1_DROBS|nr:CG30340 [Drosophila busckii]
MDFSKWDFPQERIWWRKSDFEMACKICTFVPLIVFGLYGNFMMVYLIARNRALRTPTNLIIANMAVADFLTLLICPAMFMINDFYQNYQLGCVGCKLEGFLVMVFLITAVLNLSVVSYDRLTAIVLPMETRLTLRAGKILIGCTWLAGVLLALPLAIYREYRVRVWRNFKERYCKENTNVLPKYWYVLITVLVWLPLSIMLICYSAIFYKLDRYEKRVMSREHPLTVSYKRSVAKTLFIVVIVFVALRLPFTILVVLRAKYFYTAQTSWSSGMQFFWYFSQYLMFVNAAVNPIIYGFNNENFKRAYAQIACVQRRRRAAAAATANRSHYCCYCEFMQRQRPTAKRPEQSSEQITETAAKQSKQLQKTTQDNADASLVCQLDADGFI